MRIKDWLVSLVAISVPGIMALPEPQGLGKRATGEHEIAQSSRAKRGKYLDMINIVLKGCIKSRRHISRQCNAFHANHHQ